jgi:hypothetical protein
MDGAFRSKSFLTWNLRQSSLVLEGEKGTLQTERIRQPKRAYKKQSTFNKVLLEKYGRSSFTKTNQCKTIEEQKRKR